MVGMRDLALNAGVVLQVMVLQGFMAEACHDLTSDSRNAISNSSFRTDWRNCRREATKPVRGAGKQGE